MRILYTEHLQLQRLTHRYIRIALKPSKAAPDGHGRHGAAPVWLPPNQDTSLIEHTYDGRKSPHRRRQAGWRRRGRGWQRHADR
jgi:hypothetical protein